MGGPEAGFTQRATLDINKREIYVLSGIMKSNNNSSSSLNINKESVKNTFWCFNLDKYEWKKIYENDITDPNYWILMENVEPCPRFAHQLCYDDKSQVNLKFNKFKRYIIYLEVIQEIQVLILDIDWMISGN